MTSKFILDIRSGPLSRHTFYATTVRSILKEAITVCDDLEAFTRYTNSRLSEVKKVNNTAANDLYQIIYVPGLRRVQVKYRGLKATVLAAEVLLK